MKFLLPALRLPIGIKIYGLTISILSILAGVAAGNYYQMARVNQEVAELASYTAPLKRTVTLVYTQALQQEVHFERGLRQAIAPPGIAASTLDQEVQRIQTLGQLVDRAMKQATDLVQQGIERSEVESNRLVFARLQLLLQILEEDRQELQARELTILELLRSGQTTEALLLEEELEKREAIFERRVHATLLMLNQFAEATAERIEGRDQQLLAFNLTLAAIAALGSFTLAALLTMRLIQPIRTLVKTAQAIEAGDLTVQAAIESHDETETLAKALNYLLQEVRRKEMLREAFGRYVDPRIVETLIERQIDNRGRKQVVTVFFSDLAKFSSISEMLTPIRLVNLINQYLTLATAPIADSQGVIDKFIGDAIVAFWGSPFVSEEDQATLACRAALEQFLQLQKLQRMLPEILGIRKGIPRMNLRVGLDTGEVVVGNIGTERLQSYTVMGRTVEIAEQLEQANKRYGTRILLTERTRQAASDTLETREIDGLPLGDNGSPVAIHELLGYTGEVDAVVLELRDCFARALQAYRASNWLEAQTGFQQCLQIVPNDGPSHFYLTSVRVKQHLQRSTNS